MSERAIGQMDDLLKIKTMGLIVDEFRSKVHLKKTL